jgi:hypothetical protein
VIDEEIKIICSKGQIFPPFALPRGFARLKAKGKKGGEKLTRKEKAKGKKKKKKGNKDLNTARMGSRPRWGDEVSEELGGEAPTFSPFYFVLDFFFFFSSLKHCGETSP